MNQRVLIIRNAYQQDTGGAEQYAFNLAKALKNAGHTPFIVTKHKAIHDRCTNEGILSIKGVWHESQEWSRLYYLRFLLMPLWYCWVILKYRITVIHPQGRDDFVFATNAGWLLHRPVIWTDHADLKYIMDRVNHPHPRMQSWVLNASRKVRSIICVSNNERISISEVAPELEPKLTVIHNGVFAPGELHPIRKKGKFIIGTNARLVTSKGIGELLEAFAAIHKSNPDTQLWLLGGLSGNKSLYEDRIKSLGLSYDSVKILGYKPNPNDYVASMDIFVHASYHEAFSLAIVEACMLGRSIIATAVGGTPEIINDSTGLLIPPKDSYAITKAIKKLLKNPGLRSKLGSSAKQLAGAEFDFQKIVESKVVPLYEGVGR